MKTTTSDTILAKLIELDSMYYRKRADLGSRLGIGRDHLGRVLKGEKRSHQLDLLIENLHKETFSKISDAQFPVLSDTLMDRAKIMQKEAGCDTLGEYFAYLVRAAWDRRPPTSAALPSLQTLASLNPLNAEGREPSPNIALPSDTKPAPHAPKTPRSKKQLTAPTPAPK